MPAPFGICSAQQIPWISGASPQNVFPYAGVTASNSSGPGGYAWWGGTGWNELVIANNEAGYPFPDLKPFLFPDVNVRTLLMGSSLTPPGLTSPLDISPAVSYGPGGLLGINVAEFSSLLSGPAHLIAASGLMFPCAFYDVTPFVIGWMPFTSVPSPLFASLPPPLVLDMSSAIRPQGQFPWNTNASSANFPADSPLIVTVFQYSLEPGIVVPQYYPLTNFSVGPNWFTSQWYNPAPPLLFVSFKVGARQLYLF